MLLVQVFDTGTELGWPKNLRKSRHCEPIYIGRIIESLSTTTAHRSQQQCPILTKLAALELAQSPLGEL